MATETFGQRLRRLRTERNVSQDQMAEALRTTRQTISNWENDKSAVDYFSLRDIRSVLYCSWEELMDDNYKNELFKPTAYDSAMNDNEEYRRIAHEHGLVLAYTNIAGLSKAGNYRITADDIRIATKFVTPAPAMFALVKEMKNVGYTIFSVCHNDFVVRFETDEQAKQFKQFLEDIYGSRYAHGPRLRVIQNRYYKIFAGVMPKMEGEAIRDIFDIREDENIYTLLTEGGIRGYAGSVEKAKALAEKLGLEQYNIRQEDI